MKNSTCRTVCIATISGGESMSVAYKIYIYVYVSRCIHGRVCMHVRVCISTCIHMHGCICTHVHPIHHGCPVPSLHGGSREAQDATECLCASAEAEGVVPPAATRGRPQPLNCRAVGGETPEPAATPTRQPTLPPRKDSPEEAPEEGHVDEWRKEAEVEERGGIYTAGGVGRGRLG